MKKKYIAPESEMITIQGIQLLASSYDEQLIWDDGYVIEDPDEIH